MSTSNKPKHGKGRPRKDEAPRFNSGELDHLLVFGEPEVDPATGLEVVNYLTYRELGARFNTSHTAIYQFARAHKCLKRREELRAKTRAAQEKKFVEIGAQAMAVSKDDTVHVLDMCIVSFFQALEEGRARCTSVADLNTVVRLKQLLVGDADSRSDVRGTLTLEDPQARYRAMRERMGPMTPALCGMAPRKRTAAPSPESTTPEPEPASDSNDGDGPEEPSSSGTPPVSH